MCISKVGVASRFENNCNYRGRLRLLAPLAWLVPPVPSFPFASYPTQGHPSASDVPAHVRIG